MMRWGKIVTDINSNAYWDARYAGDWQARGGPTQSRFFSNIALRALPAWIIDEIRRNHLTIADWGCGEGDGTDVWTAYAPVKQITGVDFSALAIDTAKNRYPEIGFLAEDWLAEGTDRPQFDVVFSSNVLEHFHDPRKVLDILCRRAKRAIILALPYREILRISEHFFTFTPDNIPIGLDKRFRLAFSKVIDCTKIPDSCWQGEQIILLYIDTEWGDSLKLTLKESSIEYDSKEPEIALLNSTIIELDKRSSEKEGRYLDEIRFAVSNLCDLQQQHLSAEREHADRMDTLARREQELTERYVAQLLAMQSELSQTKGELRLTEQKWFNKLREQDALFSAKHDAMQEKLIHSQQLYASLADEKSAQAEILEKRIADLRNSMELEQREQTESHAHEIKCLQLSAEKQRLEQSASFDGQLRELEVITVERERVWAERLASVQGESNKADAEWQKLFERQLDAHEQQTSLLGQRIDELQEVNSRQQEEARANLATFEARAIETHSARTNELNDLIIQKDRNFQALISYVGLLEQWRRAVEASLLFRLVSCFSRKMRQSPPPMRPLVLTLVPANDEGISPASCVEEQGIGNHVSIGKITGMNFQSAITENNEIKTVDDLLALQGTQFIDAAYHAILGRTPDQAGMSYYFGRLQRGASKVDILSQISSSGEAKSVGRVIPRLNKTVSRTKWSRVPLLGWLAPRTESTQYRVRAIEQRLSEIQQATTHYMPRLEREIAEKSLHIEGNTGVIAELQQQLAAKDAELAGTRQMLTEVTGQLNQLAHATDLSWEQFEAQILSRRHEYKGIFIQELVIDWDVPLYQRPQHIATAFGRLGYLVIFRTDNWAADNVNGFRQVEKNVWLTNRAEARSIGNAVYSFYSTAYANTPEMIQGAAQRGVVIYEYIDHIDPMISGDANNIRRLVSLKDYAFSGGADFVVASAKKLEQEAAEELGADRVILAQNGVDTDHYRNPAHQLTTLPESLIKFRTRHKKVVGYFGALAPWLWYEAIDELTAARPDLGFVFIGPDYYGGVKKLAVRDNILYTGAVDYKILPAYAQQFDVCFIPFAPGEIAKTTSPLKLFEYFALEKPVVTTADMAECVAFPEVFAGDSANGLGTAIDKAFRVKDDKAFKARLSQLADQNAWIERARAMEKAFESLVGKQ
jgi:SAM-dependent methyltransferase